MREVDSYCVGCEVCRRCGRDKEVIHYSCDSCDADSIDGETTIYSDGAYHYCLPCLLRAHMNEFIEYAIDTCGEEWCNETFEKVPDREDG